MPLGARVRYYRDKLKLTLEELANASGVDVGTINALENRDSQRSKYTSALAKAFGLTVEQLLDDSHDWLDPALQPSATQAHAPRKHYTVTRWLFSVDLFKALQHKKPSDLTHIENLIRAHLRMVPLPNAANRKRA
jgi:transcriptional regulator with XRE-family HTH domain